MKIKRWARILPLVEFQMCEASVFEMLHERFPDVLFCPGKDVYYRQQGNDDTVVVQKLVSEANTREFMRMSFQDTALMRRKCSGMQGGGSKDFPI